MDDRLKRPAPFTYHGQGKEIGVLLIHGFTGSTAEIHPLGRQLWKQGYTVHAPLLKGHGTSPEELRQTTWVDWLNSALTGYRHLQQQGCQQIVTIGHSMGGLLALKVAQHRPVQGIVSLCAPLKVRDKRIGLARYVQHVLPFRKRRVKKAAHIEQAIFPYEKTPLAAVYSLHKLIQHTYQLLPHLNHPILIVQSEQDETVDPESGRLLYQHIGSKEKELIHFNASSHLIMLDREQEELFKRITCFIQAMERMI